MIKESSKARLTGVHPDLVRVILRAGVHADFQILEGLRTIEKQREYFNAGKSKTMKSRHLTGHAVDVAPLVDLDHDGDLDLSWDWKDYAPLISIIKECAKDENVAIECGYDWISFPDAPHVQLSSKVYL